MCDGGDVEIEKNLRAYRMLYDVISRLIGQQATAGHQLVALT